MSFCLVDIRPQLVCAVLLHSLPPFLTAFAQASSSYLDTEAAPFCSAVSSCPLGSILYLSSQKDPSKNDNIPLLLKTSPRLPTALSMKPKSSIPIMQTLYNLRATFLSSLNTLNYYSWL